MTTAELRAATLIYDRIRRAAKGYGDLRRAARAAHLASIPEDEQAARKAQVRANISAAMIRSHARRRAAKS